MTGLMCGRAAYSVNEKAQDNPMTTKNPAKTPAVKRRLRRKPKRLALVIDMMLLGPGVKVVSIT